MENSHIPFIVKAKKVFKNFSLVEKSIVSLLTVIFILSGVTFVYLFNESLKTDVAETGGTIKEGVIGFPGNSETVNPLTAASQVDKDISSLLFSGLLRLDAQGGFMPDLAQSYTISDDGLTYDFILRKNATYHDDTKVTIEDILNTFQKAGDPKINPTLAAAWQGVSLQKVNDSELKVVLSKPFAPFIENFLLGILPASFSDKNLTGSGPYEIKTVKKTIGGVPEYYEFRAFKKYVSGGPHIKNIVLRFYANESAMLEGYREKEIDSLSGVSADTFALLKNSSGVITNVPVARSFGVFFNQSSQPVFQDSAVRSALNTSIDRTDLINTTLRGYGTPLYLAIPEGLLIPSATSSDILLTLKKFNGERITAAKQILHQAGWQEGADGVMQKGSTRLTFFLATPNIPQLVATANYVRDAWNAIGADVQVKVYTAETFQENVVDKRNYDALLFGQQFSHALYLSPFWDSSFSSSQNVTMYKNKEVDAWLKDAVTATSSERIQNDYQNVEDRLAIDIPAIFLYTPTYPYINSSHVHGLTFAPIENPSERFGNVKDWYIETERVWKIFTR